MMYLGENPVGLATSIPIFSDKVQIEYGEYTPQTDELVKTIDITHSLGVVPDFIIYSIEDIDLTNTYNVTYLLGGCLNRLNTQDIAIQAVKLSKNTQK